MVKIDNLDDAKELIKTLRRELRFIKSKNVKHEEKIFYTDLLAEQIKDVSDKLPKTKPYKYSKNSPDVHSEANLVLSDWHVGKKVSEAETGGYGSYNTTIMKNRAAKLVKSVLNEIELQRRVSKIEVLNIYVVGDMLDGNEIYPGHHARLENNAIEQILICASTLSKVIHLLSQYFVKVNVICISGNHGRIGKKDSHIFKMNYEYLLAHMVENNLINSKHVKFIIPEAWNYIHRVKNSKLYLTHGDTIRGMNIPRQVQELGAMASANGEDFDIIVMGHLHIYKIFEYQKGKEVIVNGNLCGTDIYSSQKLHLTSTPTQILFGIDKNGISFTKAVKL